MTIEFRPAEIDDLKEIQTLFVESIKNSCREDYNERQINAWVSSANNDDRWRSFIINQYFLLAVINGKIVGFGSLENGNYLDLLYVHKDFLRKGIANFLFEKLKAQSIDLGFNSISSDVSKTALPFFVKKGFKIAHENLNRINGEVLINYHMILSPKNL